MAAQVVGTARVVDRYPYTKTPPVPRDRWLDMIERGDDTTLKGRVWLDVDGLPRHVQTQYLEIELEQAPPDDARLSGLSRHITAIRRTRCYPYPGRGLRGRREITPCSNRNSVAAP
jgi:hypothetical protein